MADILLQLRREDEAEVALQRAQRYWRSAHVESVRGHNRAIVVRCDQMEAVVLLRRGQGEEASQRLARCAADYAALGIEAEAVSALLMQALVLVRSGRDEEALQPCSDAVAGSASMPDGNEVRRTSRRLLEALRGGDHAAALAVAERLRSWFRERRWSVVRVG